MNKRTTYEIIIAKKADQQPLPDMADTIWATVSANLEALPPSGGENPGSSTVTAAKGISSWHLVWYVAVVAATVTLAVLFWWTRSHDQSKRPKQKSVPSHTMPGQEPRKDSQHTKVFRQSPVVPLRKRHPVTIDSIPTVNDSALTSRIPKGIPIQPPIIPVIKAPDTPIIGIPPAKKPRGVKLTGSGDYKIVPVEQDSLTDKKP